MLIAVGMKCKRCNIVPAYIEQICVQELAGDDQLQADTACAGIIYCEAGSVKSSGVQRAGRRPRASKERNYKNENAVNG